jgi:hypothetical protein
MDHIVWHTLWPQSCGQKENLSLYVGVEGQGSPSTPADTRVIQSHNGSPRAEPEWKGTSKVNAPVQSHESAFTVFET